MQVAVVRDKARVAQQLPFFYLLEMPGEEANSYKNAPEELRSSYQMKFSKERKPYYFVLRFFFFKTQLENFSNFNPFPSSPSTTTDNSKYCCSNAVIWSLVLKLAHFGGFSLT